MSEFIFKKRRRNIAEAKIPLMLEIHSSLVSDKMSNFEIRDFLPSGKVFHNGDLVHDDYLKAHYIDSEYYVVYPFKQEVFDKGHTLQGYSYFVDGDNGIELYHQEPVKNPKS